MSTILDSLKKSSNQRDDKPKSSIDNFNFGHSNTSKKSSSLLFLVLLLIVVLAFIYWAYGYFKVGDYFQSQTESNPPIEQIENNAPEVTSEDKKPTNDSLSKTDKPNSDKVKQRIKDLKQKRQEQIIAQQDKKPKQAAKILPVINPNSQLQRFVDTTKPDKQPMLELTLPKDKKEVVKQEKQIKTKRKQKPKTQVRQQDYQYIYQLPFSIRKDIPKLTLNIHVYDEDAESRVVILNGVRFFVGDMIEELVLVKEITREGVLLEFNNHEFLVPKL